MKRKTIEERESLLSHIPLAIYFSSYLPFFFWKPLTTIWFSFMHAFSHFKCLFGFLLFQYKIWINIFQKSYSLFSLNTPSPHFSFKLNFRLGFPNGETSSIFFFQYMKNFRTLLIALLGALANTDRDIIIRVFSPFPFSRWSKVLSTDTYPAFTIHETSYIRFRKFHWVNYNKLYR